VEDQTFPISEIFPAIQGEGRHIGQPTVFIRFGGCDYRCSWCDTLYAVLPKYKDTWTKMTVDQIVDKVNELTEKHPIMVTLSGGNPAMFYLADLLEALHENGHWVTIETQGSIIPDWLANLDTITVSPKPPSSGMAAKFKVSSLQQLEKISHFNPAAVILKFVIMDVGDYEWAKQISALFPMWKVYLSVGNQPLIKFGESLDPVYTFDNKLAYSPELVYANYREIASWVSADHWDVTLLPQLHTLVWGAKRGV